MTGAHISTAGCTIFGDVHPECAPFFEILLLLHFRRVHGENPGCGVLGEVNQNRHVSKFDNCPCQKVAQES